MTTWRIYGKVVKPMPLPDGKGGERMVEPQSTFRALNYRGQRVSRLKDAGEYYDENTPKQVIAKAQTWWDKRGYGDCVVYEIRKGQ